MMEERTRQNAFDRKQHSPIRVPPRQLTAVILRVVRLLSLYGPDAIAPSRTRLTQNDPLPPPVGIVVFVRRGVKYIYHRVWIIWDSFSLVRRESSRPTQYLRPTFKTTRHPRKVVSHNVLLKYVTESRRNAGTTYDLNSTTIRQEQLRPSICPTFRWFRLYYIRR